MYLNNPLEFLNFKMSSMKKKKKMIICSIYFWFGHDLLVSLILCVYMQEKLVKANKTP